MGVQGLGIVASAAVIMLAVAVVVPGEDPHVRDARLRIAIADIQVIGAAFVEVAPKAEAQATAKLGAAPTVWYGPGELPQSIEVKDAVRWPLRDSVTTGDHPPLDRVPVDPWGRAYILIAFNEQAWKVLSAGPDGVLDTTSQSLDGATGDDVGGFLRR